MATELNSILVFGATGVIGKPIIRALIESPKPFDRVAIFTSPSTLVKKSIEIKRLQDKGVEVITGDLTKRKDVLRAYTGTVLILFTATGCYAMYP